MKYDEENEEVEKRRKKRKKKHSRTSNQAGIYTTSRTGDEDTKEGGEVETVSRGMKDKPDEVVLDAKDDDETDSRAGHLSMKDFYSCKFPSTQELRTEK